MNRATRPREWLLAAMPLIFALQQAIEGALWLIVPAAPHAALASALALAFLILAQVVWPVYVPLAAWAMEPDRTRRRLMLGGLAIGLAISLYFIRQLALGPREAMIVGGCIVYRTSSDYPLLTGLAYLAATTLPLAASSQRVIFVLGAIIFAGSVVAYLSFWEAFLSVWCFFAAAASAAILGHFVSVRRANFAMAPA